MQTLTIYITPDNKAVIRFPAGVIPDDATCKKVKAILREAQEKARL